MDTRPFGSVAAWLSASRVLIRRQKATDFSRTRDCWQSRVLEKSVAFCLRIRTRDADNQAATLPKGRVSIDAHRFLQVGERGVHFSVAHKEHDLAAGVKTFLALGRQPAAGRILTLPPIRR